MIYWFAVDPDRPDRLDVGLRNGLWGVSEDDWDRIEPLEPGDAVLFYHRDHGLVLCDVDSEPYSESIPVWSDAELPHRVRLSDTVEADRYVNLGEIHDCFRHRETGRPFEGVAEATAALGGDEGMFRPLTDDEIRCVFGRLGWPLPPGVAPPEEPETAEEPAEPAEEAAEPIAAGMEVEAAEEEDEPAGEGEGPGEEEGPAAVEEVQAEPETAGEEVEPEEGEAAAEETAGAGAPEEPAAPGEEPPGAALSGRRVILAPAAGNRASQERYADTITEGVDLDLLEDFLPGAQMEILREACGTGQAHVWGTPPAQDQANRTQWEASGPGDVILFTGGGHVFASASVLLTRLDEALAEELWGRREDGRTWKYLYFVTAPVEQDVPYDELNAVAGYEPAYRIPRLNVLAPERSGRVLDAFPGFAEGPPPGGSAEGGEPDEEAGPEAPEPGAAGAEEPEEPEEPGPAEEAPEEAEEPGEPLAAGETGEAQEADEAGQPDESEAPREPEEAGQRPAAEDGGAAEPREATVAGDGGAEPDGSAEPETPAGEEAPGAPEGEQAEPVEEPAAAGPGAPAEDDGATEAGEPEGDEEPGEDESAGKGDEPREAAATAVGPAEEGDEETYGPGEADVEDRAVAERPAAEADAGAPPAAEPPVEPTPEGEVDLSRLRSLLFGRRDLRRCGLCGRLLPVDLLEVVFIKPLEACTELETVDLENDVMAACGLGCASLFREGFLVVDEGVVAAGRTEPRTDPVDDYVEEIAGNRCEFWHAGSEGYFRWHAREIGGA